MSVTHVFYYLRNSRHITRKINASGWGELFYFQNYYKLNWNEKVSLYVQTVYSLLFYIICCHFRDGAGSVGTSKWIFPQERSVNPFAPEGETSKAETNATAELNNTDAPEVSLQQYCAEMPCLDNLKNALFEYKRMKIQHYKSETDYCIFSIKRHRHLFQTWPDEKKNLAWCTLRLFDSCSSFEPGVH